MKRRARVFLTVIFTGAQMGLGSAIEAQPLESRWQPGQSWRIEYLRPAPSPAGRPSGPGATNQRSIWRYRVLDTEAQGTRLEAIEEAGGGEFELWFTPPPANFRRAVKIVGSRRIDTLVHSGPAPYFGWSPAYPLIFDWPALPALRRSVTREFTDDDGQHVTEALRFTSPSRLEIVMTTRRTIDSGFKETRRCTQIWTVGRPWWSEASIRTESVIDGKAVDQTNLVGRLIP